MSSGSGSEVSPERMRFGDLEMRFLATLELDMAGGIAPYVERAVLRTTTFTFASGEEIYELTSPGGTVYVMQSMSQMVDPDLTLADLPGLGSRLELPEGWSYKVNRRITDLVLVVEGEVAVLVDDLKNTYMRVGEGSPSQTLPVLDDGTGTACSSDVECQDLDASHCLKATGLGFCTVEGCAGGECGAPYVCCHDCSQLVAPMLPFEGSACLPGDVIEQLTAAPASCTCD